MRHFGCGAAIRQHRSGFRLVPDGEAPVEAAELFPRVGLAVLGVAPLLALGVPPVLETGSGNAGRPRILDELQAEHTTIYNIQL